MVTEDVVKQNKPVYSLVVYGDSLGKRTVMSYYRMSKLEKIIKKLDIKNIKWYVEDNEGDLIQCSGYERFDR